MQAKELDQDIKIEIVNNGFLLSSTYGWVNESRFIANSEEEVAELVMRGVKAVLKTRKSEVKEFRLIVKLTEHAEYKVK